MSSLPPEDLNGPAERVVSTAEMAPEPRRRRVKKTSPAWLKWVLGAALVVVIGVFGWYELQAHPFGGPGKPVVVEVTTGESYSAATAAFSKAGVIGDPTAFRFYSMVHGRPTLLPGFYTAPKNSTFGFLHQLLAAGPNTSAL
jgi:cell division protein YceG involved in septum cleavage